MKVKLHNLRQDRDNLKVSYYLQLLHKCILEYTEQADRLLTSLRTIGAVESMIPQYRHGNVAHRLFLRLKDGGLEVPNYAGNTYTPHKLTNLLKDLGPEIRGISDELERKLECDL